MSKKDKIQEQVKEQVELPVEEQSPETQETQEKSIEELEARIAELEDKNLEMLPLVDDFERALAVIDDEGVKLIYQKFIGFLDKHDVHAIETEGADFNTDEHEAVTTFAAGEDKKGKVIDCTQKGYKLGDKVIRFAKVVVGE